MPFQIYPTASDALRECGSESVDLIITSPPYNLGTPSGSNRPEGKSSETDFHKLLKSVFEIAPRKLKAEGLLVFDIATWICAENGNRWKAVDACESWAKECSLELARHYPYRFKDSSEAAHAGDSKNASHDATQNILIFRKKNSESAKDLPEISPFSEQYTTDFPTRPEPFWPLPLVRDFVTVFELERPGITVVDPFMGSGQIGLHVHRHGGLFIGGEENADNRKWFYEVSDFEFSVEEATLSCALADLGKETYWGENDFYYVGLALVDHATRIIRFNANLFLNEKYKSASKAIFKKLLNISPSLTEVLLDQNRTVEVSLENGSCGKRILIGGVEANHGLATDRKLTEDETKAVETNFEFCSVPGFPSRITFLPIFVERGMTTKMVFSYLVMITRHDYDLRSFKRNQVKAAIERILGAVLLRRAETYAVIAHKAQRLSARAAVFARNFSHITGSHVISNPEFRHSLVGGDVMRIMRTQTENLFRDFTRAENDLFRFAVEDGRDTELLWREGAKVLDSARQHLRTGGSLLENTRRFHEYLQGRFDFIARAIDDTKDRPEPLFFVEDLVDGFLSQTAFLDNLVADVGLRRSDLGFLVVLPSVVNSAKGVCFRATWSPDSDSDGRQYSWDPVEKGADADIRAHAVMVAVPGGMVSAHAFYSLLENIIRNSAKYGSLKDVKDGSGYEVTLSLERMDGHFELRIWDNFSGAAGVWEDLQTKLEKDFVRESGEAEREGLGILEMKACAGMLCRDDDEGRYPRDLVESSGSSIPRDRNLWVEDPGSGKTRVPKRGKEPLLTYGLALNAPVLLGIVGQDAGKDPIGYRKLSHWNSDIAEIRDRWPHLMVIDGESCKTDRESWLKEIEHHHQSYPYRLLVLCKKEKSFDDWETAVGGGRTPSRRISLYKDKGLYSRVMESQIEGTDLDSVEKNSILAALEAWLRAWKGDPPDSKNPKWHLWIGMDRSEDQVKAAWADQVKEFKSDLIQLGVRAFGGGLKKGSLWLSGEIDEKEVFAVDVPEMCQSSDSAESPEARYWDIERGRAPARKVALVFDNHGNCFPDIKKAEDERDFRKATRFYQKLTGSLTPDLFRTLSHPPRDEFTFSFFIHSLVEACLTNVTVVDERVAWSLVDGADGGMQASQRFAEDLAAHQKAGVFPVFRFRQNAATNDSGFYNGRHRELIRAAVDAPETMEEEGVQFAEAKPASLKVLAPVDDEGFNLDQELRCDVLLIHEGAMDLLTADQGVSWERNKHLTSLYSIAPAVVRTSGRGRSGDKLGEHLPFIEFGEVSSALLAARNKYSLVRGLLGSAGKEDTRKKK